MNPLTNFLPSAEAIGAAGKALDSLFTSDEERDKAKAKMLELQFNHAEQQAKASQEETKLAIELKKANLEEMKLVTSMGVVGKLIVYFLQIMRKVVVPSFLAYLEFNFWDGDLKHFNDAKLDHMMIIHLASLWVFMPIFTASFKSTLEKHFESRKK